MSLPDTCAICGREKGISHSERQHSFAWRRQWILQRRSAVKVLEGALEALDAGGLRISPEAEDAWQRLRRASKRPEP
jgi:hypothetical protein